MSSPTTLTEPSSVERPQGHPRGIYTLFFTEMWERMSYYGMRALLVLFMVDNVRGGMGLTEESATAIFALYCATVYLVALPGGWVGDRLLGARGGVWWGGIVIASGHFTLAFQSTHTFFLGLLLVALGSGLLKSNMSNMVGHLYPEGGVRRDSGFTLFYMGVNLGAFLGPLICGWLAKTYGWHWGFLAAGVGMVLGLVQFQVTKHHLGDTGAVPDHPAASKRRDWTLLIGALAAIAAVTGLAMAGVLKINPTVLQANSAMVIVAVAVAYFAWAFLLAGLEPEEKRHLGVILVLFVSSVLFWAGFEQVGSSFNLFAEKYTVRTYFGWTMPAEWFQSINAFFVVLLAPVVAAFWLMLQRRGWSPKLTTKLAAAMAFLALGFLVMVVASKRVLGGGQIWPTWLISVFFLHTLGELFLSPVGLSAITKLAPPRLAGQTMGVWFLGTSLGSLLAGVIAGKVTGDSSGLMTENFLKVVWIAGIAAVVLALLAKPIQRMMGKIE